MSFACLVVLSPFIVELAMVVVLLLDAVGVLWIGRIGDSAWFSTGIDGWQGEVMMGLADCKAKIHKPVITCMRSSGEVIMSGKEFYTRRQDIAKIVSIPEIFITKIEKHESLEF
jgi:hypothetical protein